MGKSLMHITKWKSPSKKAICCIIPSIWPSGKRKTGDSKKISGCHKLEGRKGWIGRVQRIFRAVKMLCRILSWCIHAIIPLSKPTEWDSRMNPNVDYRLWVIMIYECWFINCNKCTTLVRDINNGEDYAYVWSVGSFGVMSTLFQFQHLQLAMLWCNWVTYNSTQFWYYQPRDSIRFHRLRVQF